MSVEFGDDVISSEASLSELAERYKAAKVFVNDIKQELDDATRVLRSIEEVLVARMNAIGASRVRCSDGHKVGIASYFRVTVTDQREFMSWCEEEGVRDKYIVETVKRGSQKDPGVTALVREAVRLGKSVPPGLAYSTGFGLRLYKPKVESSDTRFDDVAKGVLERLREE